MNLIGELLKSDRTGGISGATSATYESLAFFSESANDDEQRQQREHQRCEVAL